MGRWRSHHDAGSGGYRVVGAGLEARVPPLPAGTSSWWVAWWVLSTVPEASGTCRELLMDRHLLSRPTATKKVHQGFGLCSYEHNCFRNLLKINFLHFVKMNKAPGG